ncbi:hypothetical protein Y1Q_0015863 [Alligator mississippiensis]|uniref:Uncharacterized protein n=1 Tax=Alligator mississippiensis TaxID=8496 RepID=A0A151MH87_ALLMI|nr:hypothetical protein Y1Q_0015863 [Alligator mississippiensis]
MAVPAPSPGSDDQCPRLLLAIILALLACHTYHQLAHGHLGPPSSPTCSDNLRGCSEPSQDHHHHTAATWTPSSWLDTGSDAYDGILDATSEAALTLQSLQPLHLWACQASQDGWPHIVKHTLDDKQWLEAFQVTHANFWELLLQLWPHLEQQDTAMRPPFPTDTWLVRTLFKLSTPSSLCYVGHLFGVGKAKAVLEV